MKYVVTVGLRCQCMEWLMMGLRYQTVNVLTVGLCTYIMENHLTVGLSSCLVNSVLKIGLRNYNMENVETLGLEHYVVIFQATVFKVMWSPRHCQQG